MLSSELKNALVSIGLSPDILDLSEARSAILSRLASLHPDRTGGKFKDQTQQKNFQEAQGVLNLIDQLTATSNQLIPIHQISELIETITKGQTALAPTPEKIDGEQRFRRYLKRKYALPKITSAVVCSLCFAMLSLLGNFKNSPVYRSAANLVAFNKVRIINEVNRQGGVLKMREFETFLDRPDLRDRMPRTFAIPVPDHDENLEEFLSTATAISDVDIFATDESSLFKRLEQANVESMKLTLAVLMQEQNDVKRFSEPDYARKTDEISRFQKNYQRQVESHIIEVTQLQQATDGFNETIKAIREWTLDEKRKVLLQAESTIFKVLLLPTILAFTIFIWLWLRERSDETWMEYVSSDEGLESVFLKICGNPVIKSRTPPRFSHAEFITALARKEVPSWLALFVGKNLDSKHLEQIGTAQLVRLRERNIVYQSIVPTVQTWYEIKGEGAVQTSKDHP